MKTPIDFYRQQVCEGYVFTPVCHSVHGWGGVWHTPPQTDPPWADTPPGQTPPGQETATAADSMYPGVHSYSYLISFT